MILKLQLFESQDALGIIEAGKGRGRLQPVYEASDTLGIVPQRDVW